ncbi:MAG: hypothetical protein ACKO3P_07570, partial [Planctomycetaceae bacterium]
MQPTRDHVDHRQRQQWGSPQEADAGLGRLRRGMGVGRKLPPQLLQVLDQFTPLAEGRCPS